MILSDVRNGIATDAVRRQSVDTIVAVARDLAARLEHSDFSTLGDALNRSWAAKRQLGSLVTNSRLDAVCETARAAGADGAKVLGAGGGGFLLVACPPARHETVIRAMAAAGLRWIRFDIAPKGSAIIYPAAGSRRRRTASARP